jgi:hypothetical protein
VTAIDCCNDKYGCMIEAKLYFSKGTPGSQAVTCTACTGNSTAVKRVVLDGENVASYNVEVLKWNGGGALRQCVSTLVFVTPTRTLRCGGKSTRRRGLLAAGGGGDDEPTLEVLRGEDALGAMPLPALRTLLADDASPASAAAAAAASFPAPLGGPLMDAPLLVSGGRRLLNAPIPPKAKPVVPPCLKPSDPTCGRGPRGRGGGMGPRRAAPLERRVAPAHSSRSCPEQRPT